MYSTAQHGLGKGVDLGMAATVLPVTHRETCIANMRRENMRISREQSRPVSRCRSILHIDCVLSMLVGALPLLISSPIPRYHLSQLFVPSVMTMPLPPTLII